jgi:DNA-binding NtrC family response regulator
LLKVTDAKRAFGLLRNGLTDIDLVILDVDPGIHGMAILEAITARDTASPVIVVTGFEQFEMAPIARHHGASACIAKPFTAAEFVARIEEVCPVDDTSTSCTCDAWGHPRPVRHKSTATKCSGNCLSCASGVTTAVASV